MEETTKDRRRVNIGRTSTGKLSYDCTVELYDCTNDQILAEATEYANSIVGN